MVEIRKKEGEQSSSVFFRFSKKVRQSGVLVEARKRRFRSRKTNKRKRRISAQYRAVRKTEMERLKKLGAL